MNRQERQGRQDRTGFHHEDTKSQTLSASSSFPGSPGSNPAPLSVGGTSKSRFRSEPPRPGEDYPQISQITQIARGEPGTQSGEPQMMQT